MLTSILFFILNAQSLFAIVISGTATLEGQSDHAGINVRFERTQPNPIVETITTASDGSYSFSCDGGYYIITFSKVDYFSEIIGEKTYYANTALPTKTLLSRTTRLDVPARFSSIAMACTYALNGDTILISDGTYNEANIIVKTSVTIGSQFLLDGDTAHISATNIDGDGAGPIISGKGINSVQISGLTIRNGKQGLNFGEWVSGSANSIGKVNINHCRIQENKYTGENSNGGGMCIMDCGNLTIDNCIFENNFAEMDGGLCISDTHSEIYNSIFRNNSTADVSQTRGGAISVLGNKHTVLIQNCLIYNNRLGVYGGLTNFNKGGGCMFWGVHATLINTSIVGNKSDSAGAIWSGTSDSHYEPKLTLYNCIIAENESANDIMVNNHYEPFTMENCAVKRPFSEAIKKMYGGEIPYIGVMVTTNVNGDSIDVFGNFHGNPYFVDSYNGDYQLADWSRAIGAGKTTTATIHDIKGIARGNPPDLGAYENSRNTPAQVPAPVAPTLSSPANSAANQPLSLSLAWNAVDGTDTYRLQLSVNSDFSNTVVDDATLTSVTKEVGALTNNTTYYWRVNAKNAGGTGGWSDVWTFVTITEALTAPLLAEPGNNAMHISITPEIKWHSLTGADSYALQVSSSSDFSGLAVNEIGISDTMKAITGLANYKRYFFRVNAKNAGGTSGWSDVWSFMTIVEAPDAPSLAEPADNTTNQPLTLTLRWEEVPSAGSYALQVSAASDFSSLIVDDNVLTGQKSRQVSNLANNTQYYWRVNADNSGVTSAWSDVWSFTTIEGTTTVVNKPDEPELSSPSNNATDRPTTLTLNWNAGARSSSYTVQVSTASDFSSLIIDESGLTSTSRQLSGLVNSTQYYWRVNAANAGGTCDWSSPWNFSTIIQIPSKIIFSSPVNNNSLHDEDSLMVSWKINENDSVSKYWLEYGQDSLMTEVVIDSLIPGVDSSIMLRNLNNGMYWMRLRSYNKAGWGPFNDKMKFTVELPVVKIIPSEYNIYIKSPIVQNSPIVFCLPEGGQVTFEIFDINGNLVERPINKFTEAGEHSFSFKTRSYKSGIYFYRFRANKFSVKNRIVLIK